MPTPPGAPDPAFVCTRPPPRFIKLFEGGMAPAAVTPRWSIPTNVGSTPYWAHVAETCLKFAVGQFSGRVIMSVVHAALPTEVKRVKTRMYLRPIRSQSRWPWGQRILCSD